MTSALARGNNSNGMNSLGNQSSGSNTNSLEHLQANGQDVPTGKKTTTTVHLKVVWPEHKPPAKLEVELQKALQTWFSKNRNGAEVENLYPQDDGSVKVVITPESGQEDLFTKETQLTLKDQTTVLVKRVVQDGPSPAVSHNQSTALTPSAPPLTLKDEDTVLVDGPSPAVSYIQPTALTLSAPPVNGGYNISLAHFSYLNQVHSEELKRIEEEHGVQIQPVVTVSYRADPRNGGAPHQALSAFTKLVEAVSGDPQCIHYPHQPGQVDWEKTLQRIQKDQEKLPRSSRDETVCGPMKNLEVSDSISKKRKTTQNTATSGPSSASDAQGRSYRMSSKDPLVSSGLQIDPTHWAVITTACKTNLAELESRFGVKFRYRADNVKAKAEPERSEDASILESHAIRALLCLYQRVATSVMSCSLESQAHTVEQRLSGLPGVVADRRGDQWRIIGLPENLNQAVDELETNIGAVFRQEDKQKIRDLRSAVDSRGRSDVAAGGRTVGATPTAEEEDDCPICLDSFKDKTTLPCKHMFCKGCLEESKRSVGPTCPVCKAILGKLVGDQPDGKMTWNTHPRPLPGFHSCGTIIINYQIYPGKQTAKHPSPGRRHDGTYRTAYLPDNPEGKEVLHLLKRAFDQKLIFTVGTSRTSGRENQVTWNDIHHKTSMDGGPERFGYPDPEYLQRVKKELKERGIE